MIIKQGGNLGVGVDTGRPPAITYDGKWSGWYVETYGGKAYWEAVFYTSGVLTVEGEYKADLWGIGGGSCTAAMDAIAGRGSTSILSTIVTGDIAISIGLGASSQMTAGGGTYFGNQVVGAGGAPSASGGGFPYRFGDPDKAGEQGADGDHQIDDIFGYKYGEGGWLHWVGHRRVNGSKVGVNSGEGYGAGGHNTYGNTTEMGHDGVLVMRIEIK